MSRKTCPKCGFTYVYEPEIVVGPYSYSRENGFLVAGEKLKLTHQCETLAGVLLSDAGNMIDYRAIAESMGYRWLDPGVNISVLLSSLRKAFRERDIVCPIETVHGRGLRWKA